MSKQQQPVNKRKSGNQNQPPQKKPKLDIITTPPKLAQDTPSNASIQTQDDSKMVPLLDDGPLDSKLRPMKKLKVTKEYKIAADGYQVSNPNFGREFWTVDRSRYSFGEDVPEKDFIWHSDWINEKNKDPSYMYGGKRRAFTTYKSPSVPSLTQILDRKLDSLTLKVDAIAKKIEVWDAELPVKIGLIMDTVKEIKEQIAYQPTRQNSAYNSDNEIPEEEDEDS